MATQYDLREALRGNEQVLQSVELQMEDLLMHLATFKKLSAEIRRMHADLEKTIKEFRSIHESSISIHDAARDYLNHYGERLTDEQLEYGRSDG